MRQRIEVLGILGLIMLSIISLNDIMPVGASWADPFTSPISPLATPDPGQSPLPAPTPIPIQSPSATQDIIDYYGIDPTELESEGRYYVPPEYQSVVFRTEEEVCALGLDFVDFTLRGRRRTHCAIGALSDLGQEQIVYDALAKMLIRSVIVFEEFQDGNHYVCWGEPPRPRRLPTCPPVPFTIPQVSP